jgi:hypothetical protein
MTERTTRTRYSLRPKPLDPITQEPIVCPFQLRTHSAAQIYDAASLARTILAGSGPPRDPITQLPIPPSELQRLDTALQMRGICLPPVAPLHQRKPLQLSDSQCLVEVLEVRIAEILGDMFAVLEDVQAAHSYLQVYVSIMMVSLPEVQQHLRRIAHHDREQGEHLRHSLVERLRGPPNRRTFDPTERVLGFALEGLRTLAL